MLLFSTRHLYATESAISVCIYVYTISARTLYHCLQYSCGGGYIVCLVWCGA